MNSLMTNRVSGLALMGGVALVFAASLFPIATLTTELADQSDVLGVMDVLGENTNVQHLAGVLAMISVILMGFGAAWLLRVPHEGRLVDTALRVGVILMLVAWGIYAIELGMQHVVLQVAASVSSGLEGLADTLLSMVTAVHFLGFVVFGAVSSFLVGLGVARRFEAVNLYVIAGYGLAVKGVAEIINLILSRIFDVDLQVLVSISNGLLFLGGIWLFVIGYGIYRGERELAGEVE